MPSVINGLSRTLLLRGKSKSINSFVSKGLYVYTLVMFMRYIWVYSIKIKMSGDIEMNPGLSLVLVINFPFVTGI